MAAALVQDARGRDGDARIQGEDALAIDQQWIDVQRAHFGNVGGQLGQLHQCQRQCTLVGGRHVTVGLEDARGTRLADQFVGQAEVQRRQRQRLVVDHFHRSTATADHDHRAEGGVVGDADDQLACLRADNGRLYQQAIDACVRPQLAGTRQDRIGRALHRRQRAQATGASTPRWRRAPAAVARGPSPRAHRARASPARTECHRP
ncbi:hypothetical protein G6F24_015843 [Rhizopus arrhizus]|nr:hypothetical protein G6F24_015843 [Rhizopus arrhizus]